MANEIYDSTWWGNTIDTASSIGTSTEMIQGQFNLTKLGDEEVVNGDFATDSDWNLPNGVTYNSNGYLDCNGSVSSNINQSTSIVSDNSYNIVFEIKNYVSGNKIRIRISSGSFYDVSISGNGIYTTSIKSDYNTIFRLYPTNLLGSIDNVSVKEVRATTVEASKCLADAIHRIGLQDIQN